MCIRDRSNSTNKNNNDNQQPQLPSISPPEEEKPENKAESKKPAEEVEEKPPVEEEEGGAPMDLNVAMMAAQEAQEVLTGVEDQTKAADEETGNEKIHEAVDVEQDIKEFTDPKEGINALVRDIFKPEIRKAEKMQRGADAYANMYIDNPDEQRVTDLMAGEIVNEDSDLKIEAHDDLWGESYTQQQISGFILPGQNTQIYQLNQDKKYEDDNRTGGFYCSLESLF